MDLMLVLVILGFLVVTFLIFKMIKKLIFAFLTFVLFTILVVGVILGLVWLDVSELREQENFDINLIYGTSENALGGVFIPVENYELVQDNIKGFDVNSFDVDDLDNLNAGEFYIFVPEGVFESLMDDKTKYYLMGTNDTQIMGYDVKAGFSKSEVLQIMSSDESLDEFVDIIYANNDLPEFGGISAKPLVKGFVEDELSKFNLEMRDAMFASVLIEEGVEKDNVVTLIQSFKNESLEVYPNKLTFKLLRYLPTDLIVENIPFE